MLEILKFIFSSFWIFLGFLLIIEVVGGYLFKITNRIIRHLNIRAAGYPPEHLDADGDFNERVC